MGDGVLLNRLVLIRFNVHVTGFYGYLYTGRLVKTLLIRAYPFLEEFFKPSKGSSPKPLHISPLYRTTSSGVECVYSYARCSGGRLIKCTGPPSIVELDGDYYFYTGIHESIVKSTDVVSAFLNYAECFEFIKQKICVETKGVDVINPHALGEEIASKALSNHGVKVIYSSPTLLRDPLKTTRKYKTLLPSPMNTFAAPIYVKLNTTGSYRKGAFRRQLLRIHRLFNETYSVLKTVRMKWIYYSDQPIPALTGYVNYRIDENYLDYLQSQGVNLKEWLAELFAYTLTLGVGAGRAAGFGHVDLKPLQKHA